MTETRIRWEGGPDSGETRGYVGSFDRPMFRIWPPDEKGDRLLFVYLAGHQGDLWHGDTEDGLRSDAERLLEEFITSLGAVFPDDPGTMFADVMDEESFRAQFDPGCYLRYTDRDAGWPGERDYARKYLTPGEVYRIAWSDIGQSKTSLGLVDVEGAFNSVLFEPVDAPATAAPATGEKE